MLHGGWVRGPRLAAHLGHAGDTEDAVVSTPGRGKTGTGGENVFQTSPVQYGVVSKYPS
jgi:hypothetical protein